ncbi:MAG: hypothetical protein JSS27_01875 [Planctomycetes bacterium]|nr:hypothetical protein [Planctomycetota bacterium]
MPSLVFISADLLGFSAVDVAARQAGTKLVTIRDWQDLAAQMPPDTARVIVDLDTPGLDIAGVVRTVRDIAPAAEIIGYGPHVKTALLAAAEQAGCQVISRGQFHANLGALAVVPAS